ncbi:Alpha/beta hydrolase fold-1 [Panaeolus papilionaceus]|nr:Alpha/beta hydrolase fold-1 [Panaeolus papilionaceus]
MTSTKTFVFDPRPTYPYVVAVKRYWIEDSPYLNDKDALTLIFAHGTGFHKELWEPVIDDLYTASARGGGHVKIREIWTIDCPNHGESTRLNAEALNVGPNQVFAWEEYSRSIHLFLNGLGTGVEGVNFSDHKLVGVGLSMGAVSLCLALGFYPKITWHALVLCEPMIMPPKYAKGVGDMLANGAANRRDIWPSREEAYQVFTSRGTWKTWDPRTRKLFVKYGLVALPTMEYPDKEGVTLACSKVQEAACYRGSAGSFRVYAGLKHVVKQFPTHIMYGAVDDYLPAEVKDAVVNESAGGIQNLASFTRVQGGGHLVPLMNPTGVAEQIYKSLLAESGPSRSRVGRTKL